MRGLAEFIMRGRWQALAVAILGAGSLLFGWISAAAVALVTLRKGLEAGAWLLLWALLPALVAAWASGDTGSVLLLLGTFLLAVVLRVSVSLALAVLASVLVGLASGGSLLLFSADFLAQLVEVLSAVLEQLETNLSAGASPVDLPTPTVTQVAGVVAAGNAAMAVISMLLARYWQALLYNPGGFGREFRSLRLPQLWTVVLAASALVLWLQGLEASGWAMLAAVPLMFCGFALMHAWAASTGRGSAFLTAFYVLWLLVDPLKGVLVAFVVVDAFTDFRGRWSSPGPSA